MSLADAATATIYVLSIAAVALGAVIVFGRAARRRREERRALLAAPARKLLLAIAAGDDDPDQIDELVRLPDEVWSAVDANAVALLNKVRGEARAALVVVFERRGAAWRARSELRRPDPVRRARAADLLGILGRRDAVPALCDLLKDADPDVRVVAARAIGRIGDPEAARPLLESVATRRREVPAHLVAHALAGLGTGAQPALVHGMDSPRESVRAVAAEVLGLIGAVGAAARIEAALRADPSTEVRVRAARTLGRLGTRTAMPPLVDALTAVHPPALRAEAARALGELGAPGAVEALTAVLGDAEFAVAHEAARALLRLGVKGRAALTAAREGSLDVPRRIRTVAAAHAREALAVADVEEHRRTLSSVAAV
jgi:HEAT repeat protein